jgi:hypothetical protein
VRHRQVGPLVGRRAADVGALLVVVQAEQHAVGGPAVHRLDPAHAGRRGRHRIVDVPDVPPAPRVPPEGGVVVGEPGRGEVLRGGGVTAAPAPPRVLVRHHLEQRVADPPRGAVAVAPHRALDAHGVVGLQHDRRRPERRCGPAGRERDGGRGQRGADAEAHPAIVPAGASPARARVAPPPPARAERGRDRVRQQREADRRDADARREDEAQRDTCTCSRWLLP